MACNNRNKILIYRFWLNALPNRLDSFSQIFLRRAEFLREWIMSTGNGSRLRGMGGEIRRAKERRARSARTDVCYVNQPGLMFSRSPEMLAAAIQFSVSRKSGWSRAWFVSLSRSIRSLRPALSLATSSLPVWFLCRHSPTCAISVPSGPHASWYCAMIFYRICLDTNALIVYNTVEFFRLSK